MEVYVVLLIVAIALAGAVVGRWWTLAIPVVVWPIWFLGLAQEWWGYGLGEFWEYGAAFITLASMGSVAVAVELRLFGQRRRTVGPKSRSSH